MQLAQHTRPGRNASALLYETIRDCQIDFQRNRATDKILKNNQRDHLPCRIAVINRVA
jgi:hypothetical protein